MSTPTPASGSSPAAKNPAVPARPVTGLELQTGGPVAPRKVWSWAAFDWAMQPFNTVIQTFVFTAMYLVSETFADPVVLAEQGKVAALAQLSSGLGLATTIGGIAIALVAPVLGQWADTTGRRKTWLFWSTLALLGSMAALWFVQASPDFFWLGAGLVALGVVLNQISETNYNAMIVSVATPTTIGRVSGLGWGLGYSGGVAALILIAVGDLTGLASLDAPNGMTFRWIAVAGVVWGVVFGWPLFRYVPEVVVETRPRLGVVQAYVELLHTVRTLFRTSRTTFWFMVSSAVFRDGLSGVFTFGAIIASAAFGFSGLEVLIFGIAANLVAGISTIVVGRVDDRLGARRVIIGALSVLIVAGLLIVALHPLGPVVFWVGGLLLCCTVGPAQSASRSYLARQIPAGHESEMFALYATTGKAASFMAPAMWTLFVTITGRTIWGTLGILLVILVGLVLFLTLRGDQSDAR
ncbi:MFS transporter [Xylanimonas allomyrinae]|uniref:MFS transporter n=1 Tax=Xylanimonas allomyrinae TaxID=2509459 RepID=A0A4P6EQX3_9MICO|nr:MFS transporter [Xylanimonas allomyrinae]QAY62717.1 MFS transporter [Xylanimonas allomyrinae]